MILRVGLVTCTARRAYLQLNLSRGSSRHSAEAMVQTIRLPVTDPTDAFSRLRADGDLTSPMLFGIIVSWICMLLSQLWTVLLSNTLGGALGDMEGLEVLFEAPSLLELVVVMVLWPVIFENNKGKISDPDLIYPGPEFRIPRDIPETEMERKARRYYRQRPE